VSRVRGLAARSPARTGQRARVRPALVVGAGWAAGAIPFANLAARRVAGVDLRDVGNGTVSGTALYDVTGFGPLAVAGLCDVAKGTVGPLLAGRDRPVLAAIAASAAVAGHNWSPWLRGAGGRGVSVAMGALAVGDVAGTSTLAAGLAAGRALRQTGLGCFAAQLAVTPVLWRRHGWRGAAIGLAVTVPMLAKRVAGNGPLPVPRGRAALHRLLFDCDPGRTGTLS
jgi:glycerol-3-phosphate acyltransferase PlsY